MNGPPDDDRASPVARPVFVLGCAWRCGSTLLQRVLTTSPELHVWGENHGAIDHLGRIAKRLAHERPMFERSRKEFARGGHNGFIANLNPTLPAAGIVTARAWLATYYDEATRALGKPRWGFKDVRYDADHARFLLEVYPEGRVLFLVRDPVSVLASARALNWRENAGGARGMMQRWIHQTGSFLAWADPRALVVRYEALVAEPAREMQAIARHVGVPFEGLDLGVFEHVVRGTKEPPRIEGPEAMALRRPEVRRAVMAAGYPDPAGDPRAVLAPALIASARRGIDDLRTLPERTRAWLKQRRGR